jgi:hypothetical protein
MNDELLIRQFKLKTFCFCVIGKVAWFFMVAKVHPYFSCSTSFFKHDANFP